jgi:molybdenum cofactor cytidylyltransferase
MAASASHDRRERDMIAAEKTALVLLAAGRSERFGTVDKLLEPFLGRPLALHITTALEAVPFARRIVVKDGTELDFGALGYHVVHNPAPHLGLIHSAKLGIEQLRDDGVEAVLFALADMPRVTAGHIHHMLHSADGPDAVVASSNGVRPCPPVLFGANQFDALRALDGDQDARALVLSGKHVVASPAELIDIDTPEELERLRGMFPARWRGERERS